MRFEVRGCRARDVVAYLIGAAPSDAPMALDVPDPRERVDEAPTPSEAIFSESARRASSAAVAARTDDKINSERHADDRPAPLRAPCLVVPRPAAHGAGGWDVVAPPNWGRPLWHALVRRARAATRAGAGAAPRRRRRRGRGHGRVRICSSEGPGRPRREKKRWVPVAKKKAPPPPAAEGKS